MWIAEKEVGCDVEKQAVLERRVAEYFMDDGFYYSFDIFYESGKNYLLIYLLAQC